MCEQLWSEAHCKERQMRMGIYVSPHPTGWANKRVGISFLLVKRWRDKVVETRNETEDGCFQVPTGVQSLWGFPSFAYYAVSHLVAFINFPHSSVFTLDSWPFFLGYDITTTLKNASHLSKSRTQNSLFVDETMVYAIGNFVPNGFFHLQALQTSKFFIYKSLLPFLSSNQFGCYIYD